MFHIDRITMTPGAITVLTEQVIASCGCCFSTTDTIEHEGYLLVTSCSRASSTELLKFCLHLDFGAPPSLDLNLPILDFVNFLSQCVRFLCAHIPAVFFFFMDTDGAFTFAKQECGFLWGKQDSSS